MSSVLIAADGYQILPGQGYGLDGVVFSGSVFDLGDVQVQGVGLEPEDRCHGGIDILVGLAGVKLVGGLVCPLLGESHVRISQIHVYAIDVQTTQILMSAVHDPVVQLGHGVLNH